MKQEEFTDKTKEAAKEFASKKKVPSQPETQFIKGAMWAWDLLMTAKTSIYYEEVLRQDICNRYNIAEPEHWQMSLIRETADMMAERDEMQEVIRDAGRLLTKVDKNMQTYKESNPLYVHLKELQRSIGMQREHLGLSAKSAKKMEPPKNPTDPTSKAFEEYIDGIANN